MSSKSQGAPAATVADSCLVPAQGGPELSIVVPTFNERGNISELLARLERCLDGIAWEVVFVDDDSPDGTADVVREIASVDHRVRCIRRIGRRGLSSACIEGMLSSTAPFLAVMDADLQHDERLLPEMLSSLRPGDLDIVIGSRYVPGGGTAAWDLRRLQKSRLATRLSRLVLKSELADPMSGFFMLRNESFQLVARELSGLGFKILLDIFASAPQPLRYKEIGYEFRVRHSGRSKLDSQVAWNYVMLLLDKLFGHIIPVRFVAFGLVGAFGVGVHLSVQAVLLEYLGTAFVTSQAVATVVAMTSNYAVNNILTFRDLRLHGWAWVRGWLSFCAACSVGAIANVGIAAYIFSLEVRWILAAIAGILVSAVWNYAVTAVYTWRKPAGA